jgi:hypothetical protein
MRVRAAARGEALLAVGYKNLCAYKNRRRASAFYFCLRRRRAASVAPKILRIARSLFDSL